MRPDSRKKNNLNHEQKTLSGNNRSPGSGGQRRGVLNVVGIRPGGDEHLSSKARKALLEADLIVGYTAYIRLIGPLITDQELFASGTRKELEQARKAVAEAVKGRRVCLISSGDPGIYGMAGPLLQLIGQDDLKQIELAIVPGITAASAAVSALGAPLMHDFAVISLSNLLTDSKLIEQRIEYATRSDFIIVFYNPQSSRRRILLGHAVKSCLNTNPRIR